MSSFPRVLLAEYATFILVFLKTFVTALVSLPKYVNFDQCVFSVSLLCFLELEIDLRTDVLYPLFCRISCIITVNNLLIPPDDPRGHPFKITRKPGPAYPPTAIQ